MAPILKRTAWIGGGILGGLLAFIVLLLLFLNTPPGRDAIQWAAPRLTGGEVTLSGLSGRVPDRLKVAHLAVADAKGVWLTIDDVALDWSPLDLIGNTVTVEKLTAGRIAVLRKPVPSQSSSQSTTRIHVDALSLARVDVGAAVAGRKASVTLSGSLDYVSTDDVRARIAARRLDAPGTYDVDASVTPDDIAGTASLHEPGSGLIGGLMGLPDLGPLALEAHATGPRNAQQIQVSLAAGALQADAHGTVDLVGARAQLLVAAGAPAMAPGPGLAWSSLSLHGRLSGSFTKPDVDAHLMLDGLKAGQNRIASITADVTGRGGGVHAAAAVSGLLIQGLPPDFFGTAPVKLTADARFDTPQLPLSFDLTHPLLHAAGKLTLKGGPAGTVTAALPALAPFAKLAGLDLPGHAALTAQLAAQNGKDSVTLDGTLAAEGAKGIAALIGRNATLHAAAAMQGGDITLSDARFTGARLAFTASGGLKANRLALDATARLADVAQLAPTLAGDLALKAHAEGPMDDLAVTATADGHLAAGGAAKGPLHVAADLTGLPGKIAGTMTGRGTLNGGALRLDAALRQQGDGALAIRLSRADWKSLAARADLTLPRGASLPAGTVTLHDGALADLSPFIGTAVGGTLDGSVRLSGTAAQIALNAANLAAQNVQLAALTVKGGIANLPAKPQSNLTLDATGLSANGITGEAHLAARGPLNALALTLTAALADAQKNPAHLNAAAMVDATKQRVALNSFSADYRGQTAKLDAPAHLDLSHGAAIDRLQLTAAGAGITLAGRAAPALDATLTVRNVTPQLIALAAPGLLDKGTFAADAHVTGTPAAPTGTLSLKGSGIVLHGAGAGAPAATVSADATLDGTSAAVKADVGAGKSLALAISGTAPLAAGGAIAIAAKGDVDLALANPILNAEGRNLRGTAHIDGHAGGTLAAPSITGQATLTGGDFQDYTQGVHLADITGTVDARGNTITLTALKARAGQGNLSAQGSVDLWSPGMPVDLTLTAHNAHLLSSTELSMYADADLKLTGQAARRLRLSGTVHIARGEVDLPDQMPSSVAVLDVRYPGRGTPAPPPPSRAPVIAMDLTVTSPGRLFVRGHGLDAEVSGRLHVQGTSNHPDVTGGFDMRRGDFSLAGQTLTFTSGRLAFDGVGPAGSLDPALNFVAQSTSGSVTATLTVTGYASKPVIKLTSTPSLPQDEVLAHLLFQQSTKQLGPLQMAEIAEALSSLTGVGGIGNPLSAVRKSLGLDRLSVGGSSSGNGASVEAGKYIANGVYVGAKQDTSGQTQAQVQIDLTRHLKAETTINTGSAANVTGAAAQVDQGSSVGLSYQFDY